MRETVNQLLHVLGLVFAVIAGWQGYQVGGWGWAAGSFVFMILFCSILATLLDVIWRLFSRLSR